MTETPLNDLTVIDFTHARAGPWCTQVLGDLGAEILLVERPGTGDPNRNSYPQQGGMGVPFISRHRNKKSIVINLKHDEGRRVAEELIRDADVVAENFAPGVMERLGLGYKYLQNEVNSQLVYASIKGYGETGPYRDKKGVDLVMQAEAGIMSVTGPDGGPPVKVGQAIGDIGAGLYAVIGILTALRRRDATGSGQKFETDLFGTIVSFMEEYLTIYGITGENPEPLGTRHQTDVPYELFETKDGHVALYVPGGRWDRFVEDVLDDDSLKEYDTTELRQEFYEEIMAVMRPIISERTTAEWVEWLTELGYPCGPLNTVSDVIAHPQARERGYVFEYEDPHIGEVILPGYPMHFSDDQTEVRHGPPQFGEHTATVLRDHLGLSKREIDDLRDCGAIE